jgi:5-methyltetrahydrofolate--homocysteine methyltransferase
VDRKQRIERLKQELSRRILVLDGAMGTAIQAKNLTVEDFGGPALEGCNEHLVLTRPDIIGEIHESYLKAGADILETDTFGATPLVLAEYDLASKALEINEKAASLARHIAEKHSTPDKPRFVAGSMGPTTKALSVTGGITFEELIDHFYVQAKGLYQGGADYFLLETCQDTRNIKAGIFGIQRLLSEVKEPIPIAVSVTIEPMGTLLAGQAIDALAASLAHLDLLYIGLNCATGPEFMTDHIRTLAGLTKTLVACVPNAGLPDENGKYLETPEMIARVLSRFIESGWINLLGGCCGTTPVHIRALSELAEGKSPRVPRITPRSFVSGIDYLEITDDLRPVIVGERTNVIGSRKFKQLIAEGKYEEASEVGRAQVKQGAAIIDICMADPDRDEVSDMEKFLEHAIKKVRVPLMFDSTDAKVFETALPYSQGKAILNSINLEDGEERFEKVVPLAKKFGAALVVGLIDEDKVQGMAVTRQRKVEIAARSYDLLVNKYGVEPEDIFWDCLVFPAGTGDANYIGSAVETIEGIREVKKAFPRTKTILGVSNVSFGLPPAGREVLNSVFLYHCVQAGLDLAIVNAEKLERYPSIPEEERKLAEDLLWYRGEDPVAAFANYFRQKQPHAKKDFKTLPLEERLARYIIEGSKDGLYEDLNEALQKQKPLEIINGPLMKGMDEVGRLFNKNELIVAEVLQSAEAMKAAVSHLEPHMDKVSTASRGKVILATVKGDVHDIGKNLVDIILSNNGFTVINLGIKIPPEQLIAAIEQHRPNIVGLSGLLVKSAQQMVLTADDLSKAGIKIPMLVGGAALSRNFTDLKIARAYSGVVAYASDAMDGLDLAKKIQDPTAFERLKEELKKRQSPTPEEKPETKIHVVGEDTRRSSQVPVLEEIPAPPDHQLHVIRKTPLDHIWPFINPLMLYGRHLGIKGRVIKLMAQGNKIQLKKEEDGAKALEIYETVEQVKEECRKGLMRPAAVYQFFDAASAGNRLFLFKENSEAARFDFPRQKKPDGLCLADYANPLMPPPPPLGPGGPFPDNVCLFVVTAGAGIREKAEEWKNKGEYLKSFALQALALETAEGYAEYLHARLRSMWGFPDPPDMKMVDRFQAKYRGKRYSPGYPACPRLEDQEIIFKLLKPEEIGVHLTEGHMMDPEAAVSAIVFHHPAAVYYGVGQAES